MPWLSWYQSCFIMSIPERFMVQPHQLAARPGRRPQLLSERMDFSYNFQILQPVLEIATGSKDARRLQP